MALRNTELPLDVIWPRLIAIADEMATTSSFADRERPQSSRRIVGELPQISRRNVGAVG